MTSLARRIGHGHCFVAVVLAGGLVGGCGSSSDSGGGATTSTTTTTTKTTTTTTTTTTTPPKPPPPQPPPLAWVPFGPNDPTIPDPGWPVYRAFAQGNCPELRKALDNGNVGDFGTALQAVCDAAVGGHYNEWKVAASHASADTTGLDNPCVERLLQRMLNRALDWHEKHPNVKPKVGKSTVKGKGKTTCALEEEKTTSPSTTNETSTSSTTSSSDAQ